VRSSWALSSGRRSQVVCRADTETESGIGEEISGPPRPPAGVGSALGSAQLSLWSVTGVLVIEGLGLGQGLSQARRAEKTPQGLLRIPLIHGRRSGDNRGIESVHNTEL
jgi:hypothetical protein